jgi:SAM-dependent methyltransferase
MALSDVGLPPAELILRIGDDPGDTMDRYLENGRRHRAIVENYLPEGWDWEAKTYLDWGSGAGRMIRHFLPEASTNRIIAADIDEPSVQWIRENLGPIEGLLVDEQPGVDLEDNSVDLVTGFSVMTHITDHWAGWLLEMRRVLKPGGLALLSFCGEAMIPRLLSRPVAIDDIGMLWIKYGNPWSFGGPTVLHSPWWIRAHWGRAFEIVRLDPSSLRAIETSHDLVLMRRPTEAPPSINELRALTEAEPREVRGLMSALDQAREELGELRTGYEAARLQGSRADNLALELSHILASHSWRITRPLRKMMARMRNG